MTGKFSKGMEVDKSWVIEITLVKTLVYIG